MHSEAHEAPESAGVALRRLRKRAGLSGRELARQASIPASTFRAIERGSVPSRDVQRVLAGALTTALQRQCQRELDEARARLVRAELELTAARVELDKRLRSTEADIAQLRVEYHELWPVDDELAA